ncbi:MBL fold metallo-hydrolase [Corynebacterium bovis]|uniref:MBL fold metallo-hydrolase n=1 Tax=Corynebacterium bovis TaxID=36808 RepID=UPI00313922EA
MELITVTVGPFGTNCHILHRDGAATVVDPGHGAAAEVRRVVAAHGLTVDRVLLTHGHIDHIRDAGEVARDHDVPVLLHREDHAWLTGPGRPVPLMCEGPLGEMFGVADMVPLTVDDVTGYGETVDIAGETYTVHHTPGHSPGSVMLHRPGATGEGEPGAGTVIGGDVLFRGGVGRTDLPLSSPEAMARTLRRLPGLFGEHDVVLPGHGPSTTVGHETRTNPFLRQAGGL